MNNFLTGKKVDEIAPSLRYCADNIGEDKAVDLLELRSQGILENFEASQDVCRLFDIIIQQINELMSLDGLKDEKKAQSKYSQELLAYKSLERFTWVKLISHSRRWKEASYVFNVSEKLAKDMKSNQYPSILKEMVVDLAKNAALERSVALANLAIEKYEEIAAPIPQKAHKSKKPLAERLDEFRGRSTITFEKS
ncbi:signal recognition particle 68 kda protein [Holotrichia oblita]|uniref:Signal recognition particle 68 kDa protein n=1 Tax=Holotrichia oblita TaxID=644536 RepID=A0ACB9ST86_HOLOL|nr:signal recognition particle 68 kda protein [Holotrichia oblita]